MNPERTDYVTNGVDGLKRLATGPDLNTYRGIQIINSRKFSMETGTEPRDLLRRKVRVGEYYLAKFPQRAHNKPLDEVLQILQSAMYELYDQSRDTMVSLSYYDLALSTMLADENSEDNIYLPSNAFVEESVENQAFLGSAYSSTATDFLRDMRTNTQLRKGKAWEQADIESYMNKLAELKLDLLIIRPAIEHKMLGLIFGRGGTQELGATFWGQTELSCYDDAQHGIWGMSYKYHERAMVTNERNLSRVFDIAYDGYVSGMDCEILDYSDEEKCGAFENYIENKQYSTGCASMFVIPYQTSSPNKLIPNPLVLVTKFSAGANEQVLVEPESGRTVSDVSAHQPLASSKNASQLGEALFKIYTHMTGISQWCETDPGGLLVGAQAIEAKVDGTPMMFQGTIISKLDSAIIEQQKGSGHLGQSYPGVASVREGRGYIFNKADAKPFHLQ